MAILVSEKVWLAIRAHLGEPVVLGCLFAIVLVLGLSGPFDTLALLPPGPRLIYWAIVVSVGYVTGTVIYEAVSDLPRLQRLRRALQVLVIGTVQGTIQCGFMLILNRWLFAARDHYLSEPHEMFAFCVLIGVIVSALHAVRTVEATAARSPALLDRLPADMRGALICLTVQDHYVEVFTTAGRYKVLIRLSDAIRETAPEPGLQIQGSHWVALAQVRDARRRGDTAVLVLTGDEVLPVSRTYVAAVEAAGLLPARSRLGAA